MDADANLQEHLKKCRWVRINWLWSKVGRVNLGIFLRFNPLVSLLSACIIWGFVAWCMVKSDAANEEMGKWKIWITEKFTWMYIGTQDIWAVIIIMLYFSKYSNMKLGRDDEEPEFNDATYFTMLFAAGIGIGLFYFGVGKLVSNSFIETQPVQTIGGEVVKNVRESPYHSKVWRKGKHRVSFAFISVRKL